MYILADIGATKIRLALVNFGTNIKSKITADSFSKAEFSKPIILQTPSIYIDTVLLLKNSFRKIVDDNPKMNFGKIKGVIVGIAGVLNEDKSSILRSPNMSDFENKPIKNDLQRIVGAPVYIFNDTDLGALGENFYGAGIGFSRLGYMTISTGVGGSLIEEGNIAKYFLGLEPGFQIINNQKLETIHDILAGTSIEKKYGLKSEQLKDEKVWDYLITNLAIALHNTIIHWSPEVMVLGGSQMRDIPIPILTEKLKKVTKLYPRLPEIKMAELGSLNGLYGALEIAKRLERDSSSHSF